VLVKIQGTDISIIRLPGLKLYGRVHALCLLVASPIPMLYVLSPLCFRELKCILAVFAAALTSLGHVTFIILQSFSQLLEMRYTECTVYDQDLYRILTGIHGVAGSGSEF